jgi:hypothetical protein
VLCWHPAQQPAVDQRDRAVQSLGDRDHRDERGPDLVDIQAFLAENREISQSVGRSDEFGGNRRLERVPERTRAELTSQIARDGL